MGADCLQTVRPCYEPICQNGPVVQLLTCVQLSGTLWTAVQQASLSFTVSQSLLKLMSLESVMLYNHLILCHPFLLPSVFPSIRVFSIRWPKYWSFSFNISPSSEYSGLISLRIDWFDWLVLIHELLGRKNLCCPTHPLALPPRRKSNKNTGRN